MKVKHLIPDKANCTYWWIMYMDNSNPLNKSTVKEMHGYSKFQNQAEAIDKNNVLMAKLEMLYKNGYLQKSNRIEIFKRVGPLPSKQQDTHFLTLFEKHYIIPDNRVDRIPHHVMTFLRKFYDAIALGKEVKNLRPLPDKTKMSKDQLFNISSHNFSSHLELYEFASKQLSRGEAPGMVEDFVRRYSERHFSQGKNKMDQLAVHFGNKYKTNR